VADSKLDHIFLASGQVYYNL